MWEVVLVPLSATLYSEEVTHQLRGGSCIAIGSYPGPDPGEILASRSSYLLFSSLLFSGLVSFRISQWDNPTYHRGYITRLRYHTSYSLSLSCSSIGNTWHALQNHVVKSFFYLLVATQYKTLVMLSQYL